jgi:hypothetical protein
VGSRFGFAVRLTIAILIIGLIVGVVIYFVADPQPSFHA